MTRPDGSSSVRTSVLVAFDRATLPWHAGQVLRAGQNDADSCSSAAQLQHRLRHQARLLTEFWADEGHAWDWLNRVVYLQKSTSTS